MLEVDLQSFFFSTLCLQNVVSKFQAFGKTLAGEKAAAKKAAATQAAKPFSQVTALKPLDKVVNKQEHAVAAKATATKPLTTRAKSAKKEEEKKVEVPSKIVNLRRSVDLEKSEDNSLYVSALEDISEETTSRRSTSSATRLLVIFQCFSV